MEVEDRWRAVHASQDGMTYEAIEKNYGYTCDFIARWVKRYRETGTVEDAPREGRPLKLTTEEDMAVRRSLKRKATGSLRKTAKKFKTEHGFSISKNTVARSAERTGLVYRIRKPKPLLSDRDKLARLRFARRRRPRGYWRRLLWSDEASFALYSNTKGEWVEAGSQAAPRETVKWPPRIRVWAAIGAWGKTPLVRIPKSMNAAQFEVLLQHTLLPILRDIGDGHPDNFVFQQDHDGTHTAKRVQKMLADEGIELLEPWAPHSPDISPIENAWSIVEQHLELVNPRTERGLWDAMQEGWENIESRVLLRLCNSIPRRLKGIIAAEGGHIHY